MYTLFISTYSNFIIVGILKNGLKISFSKVPSIESHSIHLVPTLEKTLKDNFLSLKDLNEIIVVVGPGSFTGVRLGIIVAKTLSYTLKIPIKTITSIDAIALSNNIMEKKIVTTADKKGKYYGIYENNILVGELNYLSEESFENLFSGEESIITDDYIDIEKICLYLKDKENINPHKVNAAYIKEIDVYNGK